MTRKRVIGVDNRLPWHLPADLKRFKQLTMGHPIIMGRKTYDSIGRPLPGRRNIVLSRNSSLAIPGVDVMGSLSEALRSYEDSAAEVFVIGGSSLFEESLPKADRIYMTWVEKDISGDTYFPNFDFSKLKIIEDSTHDGEIPFRYVTYSKS